MDNNKNIEIAAYLRKSEIKIVEAVMAVAASLFFVTAVFYIMFSSSLNLYHLDWTQLAKIVCELWFISFCTSVLWKRALSL